MTCTVIVESVHDHCTYSEIDSLADMLKDHSIPFEIDEVYNGSCISYPTYDHVRMLVTENAFSYGRSAGLLEVADILADQILGFQTANDVFRAIKADWQYRHPIAAVCCGGTELN